MSEAPKKFWKIHSYLVGDIIDSGTFSTIRLAYHNTSFRPYALKIISKTKLKKLDLENGSYTNRSYSFFDKSILFGEQIIAPLLNHKNIVKTIESVETPKAIFQFMELCSDGNLLDILCDPDESTSYEQRLIYLGQIIDAIYYLHHHYICHRDLKLENILIQNGVVKLCDFGFAALCAGDSARQAVTGKCGSVEYVAPEVMTENSYDGCAADMWSLGILIYKMFLSDPEEIEKDVKFENIDFNKIPSQISELIHSVLVTDSDKRLKIAQFRTKYQEILKNLQLDVGKQVRSNTNDELSIDEDQLQQFLNPLSSSDEDTECVITKLCEIFDQPKSRIIEDLNVKEDSHILNKQKVLAVLMKDYISMTKPNLSLFSNASISKPQFLEKFDSSNHTQKIQYCNIEPLHHITEFPNKSINQICKAVKHTLLKHNFCVSPTLTSSSAIGILNTENGDITLKMDFINGENDSCLMTLIAPKEYEKVAESLVNEIKSLC